MSNKTYPEWQAGIREVQDRLRRQHEEAARKEREEARAKAFALAVEHASRFRDRLNKAGLNLPDVNNSAWSFDEYGAKEAPKFEYSVKHHGYTFALRGYQYPPETAQYTVSDGQNELNIYSDRTYDQLLIADAIDRLANAHDSEVGAAD